MGVSSNQDRRNRSSPKTCNPSWIALHLSNLTRILIEGKKKGKVDGWRSGPKRGVIGGEQISIVIDKS